MPFGLHLPELIIVLVVALLIFGPKKLPEMGSAIGKSIKEFRKGMHELSGPEVKNNELRAPVKDALEETSMPISSADLNKLQSTSYTGEEVSANKPND
jgi:TatA/E family protein of Tat protein translocase